MLINYKSPNKGVWVHKDAVIVPGVNEVPDHFEKDFAEHPEIKKMVDKGHIEIVAGAKKGAVSDAGKSALAGMQPAQAVKLVKDTANPMDLQKWLEVEKRPSVVKAIEAQLKAIDEMAGEEKKDS